jgi:hypothetical protein
MAGLDTGGYRVSAIQHPVFWGYGCEMINPEQKRREVTRFLVAETSHNTLARLKGVASDYSNSCTVRASNLPF